MTTINRFSVVASARFVHSLENACDNLDVVRGNLADSKSLEQDHQVIRRLVHLAKCHILHHLMAKAVCAMTSCQPHYCPRTARSPVTGISPFDPSPPGLAGREVIGHEPFALRFDQDSSRPNSETVILDFLIHLTYPMEN